MVEEIDKKFAARAFGEGQGYLYEYDWLSIYKFEYLGANTALNSPAPLSPRQMKRPPTWPQSKPSYGPSIKAIQMLPGRCS